MEKDRRKYHERRVARLLEGVPAERHAGLLACDPTPHKEFAGYLGRLYRQSRPGFKAQLIDEDASKARAYLWAAHALNGMQISIKLNDTHDNGYKEAWPLSVLFLVMEPQLPKLAELPLPEDARLWLGDEIASVSRLVESTSKTYSAEEQALLDAGSLEIIFDQGPLKLWKINDHAGAKFAGRGTKWCTTEADPQRFINYDYKGSLFALAVRGTTDKYQMHFNDFQLTNAQDVELEFEELCDDLPVSSQLISDFKEALAIAAASDSESRGCYPWLKDLGALSPKISVECMQLAARMASSLDWGIRIKPANDFVAIIPNLPRVDHAEAIELAVQLAKDSNFSVREKASHRLLLCVGSIAPELQDAVMPVLSAAAVNGSENTRMKLAEYLPTKVGVLSNVSQIQAMDLFDQLAANSPLWRVRYKLADHLPIYMNDWPRIIRERAYSVIGRLSMDEDTRVRETVVRAVRHNDMPIVKEAAQRYRESHPEFISPTLPQPIINPPYETNRGFSAPSPG